MHSRTVWRRILFWIGRELIGLVLLTTLVLALATMPPMFLRRTPDGSFQVKVDTVLWSQKVKSYVATVKQGTLGKNRDGLLVAPLVAERLAFSLRLIGVALAVALVLGVAKGIADFQSLRKKRFALGPAFTGLVQGFPDFWLILMIQVGVVWLVKTFHWKAFPLAWVSEEPVASMVYPVFALALVPWAYVARITSTAIAQVYDQDYVRTARAKGLREWQVLLKHALANSVVPILDGLPNALAVMFATLLMVETLFDYPGIASTLGEAVLPAVRWPPLPPAQVVSDTPVVVASGVLLMLVFWVFYLAVGLLRQIADPRLKGRDRS